MTRFTYAATLSATFAAFICAGPAPAGGDVLAIQSAGLEKLLVDERDQGLKQALLMIDKRIAELPIELEQPGIPVGAIQLVLEVLRSPMTLRAGILEGVDPEQEPPFWVHLSIESENAASLADRFAAMSKMFAPGPGQAHAAAPALTEISLGDVQLIHGMADGKFTIAINRLGAGDADFGKLSLPNNVSPGIKFRLDFGALKPLLDMMPENEPGAEMVQQQLAFVGIGTEHPMVITGVWGSGADRAYGVASIGSIVKLFREKNLLASAPLSPRDLNLIPADATIAQLKKGNLKAIPDYLRAMYGPMMAEETGDPEADPFELVTTMTGIDLEKELFAHLGELYGGYMSDTTGGGGLFSAVALLQVTNPDGLAATLKKIAGTVNSLTNAHARGYVQLREWEDDGLTMTSLMFPGIPIPLEISYTLSDGYLIAAASPQNLHAAVSQIRSGAKGLGDNAEFRRMGGNNLKDAHEVTWMDTPRLARSGYGLTSMLMAALANGVRSPSDPMRNPGSIMPPLGELMKGALPCVSIGRIVGDEVIYESQGDRSWLVNGSAAVGLISSVYSVPAVAMGAALFIPALTKARGAAQEMKAMSQLSQIHKGYLIYADIHNGKYPEHAALLISEQLCMPGMFVDPSSGNELEDIFVGEFWMGDYDGSPESIQALNNAAREQSDSLIYQFGDFWFVRNPKSTVNPRIIFGWTEPGHRGSRSVVFEDNHVEQLDPFGFQRAVEQDRQVRQEMGWPDPGINQRQF